MARLRNLNSIHKRSLICKIFRRSFKIRRGNRRKVRKKRLLKLKSEILRSLFRRRLLRKVLFQSHRRQSRRISYRKTSRFRAVVERLINIIIFKSLVTSMRQVSNLKEDKEAKSPQRYLD